MELIERGVVREGGILFANPLPFPEGTEVAVRIQPASEAPRSTNVPLDDFLALPLFGMWRDRTDISDSTAIVRKEREHWHHSRPFLVAN